MVPSHIWRLSRDGEPIFFNKRMVDFLGFDVPETERPGRKRLDAVIEAVHPDDAAEFREKLDRSLATGKLFGMRYRLRRLDGVYRWMSSSAVPIHNAEGHIVQWYGLCHDIDDQMHAEEALRRSEWRLRQLIDAVPAMIWSTTPGGMPTYINSRFIDVTGATLADITSADGKPSLSVIHPDYRQAAAAAVAKSFRTGDPYYAQYRQLRSDGSYRWTETRAAPLRDEAGEILQWYGVSVDIHEMVLAQEALRDRERELSQLVNMVPSLLWRLSPHGEPVFFSKRMIDFIGFDVNDADWPNMDRLTAIIKTVVYPDDADNLSATLNRSLATGESFSMRYRLRRADGVYRWMDCRAEPMRDEEGRIVQWYGLSHDIDDQVHVEEELRTSKRQLEQMIDAVPVNILSFDSSGKVTYTSKRYLEKVGSPLAHIQDFDALAKDLAHPDDFPTMHRRASEGFATGQPFVNRFRRRDIHGAYRWIEARAQPLRDENGAIVQWYIASIDLEDEMRALQALRESERSLRQLVETLPAMIYCATPDGEPTYRSQLLRAFLGFDVDYMDGTGKSRLESTLSVVIHPDDLAMVNEKYAYSLATGEQYASRHRLRRFDGKWRWVETRAAPMRNSEGRIVQWNGVCLDIDGEVRTQEELRLAQEKMARASQAASLAELSASIAHEVNQPLAAVVANSHACQRWLTIEPPNLDRAQRTVERIIRDANAAGDVVNRIRALFKRSMEVRSSTAVGEIIMDACGLMAEEAQRRSVRVDVDIAADIPPLALDRVQIQQVVINLMRNSMEAMEMSADAKTLAVRARKGDNVVRIEVRDRGRGVENPEKIFEPFFTTKESGMGMGLAICRSIVESHGGKLLVEGNEDGGATFVFILPIGISGTS